MSGFETTTSRLIASAPVLLVWAALLVMVFSVLETIANFIRLSNLDALDLPTLLITLVSAILRSLVMPAALLGLAALIQTLRERDLK
ncbi:MAG: hypothetical protein AAGA28_04130 [Pseudomonadota bacterium]